MRTIIKIIPPQFDGQRVFSFLKRGMEMSTSLIRTLKTQPNGILLNGSPVRTVDPAKAGDELTINIPPDGKLPELGTEMPNVIYFDEDILVVNKPPTMAVHESHNHSSDTLANCVALFLHEKGIECAFRCVGRLDKGTSGIVIAALNPFAAAKLNGRIQKEYLAIPTGRFEGSGTIDAPIFRPDAMKTYRIVDERGERAVTHWEAIETGERRSLVRVRLETGRTHQIRVHFAHLGTPLYGDTMYGIWVDAEGHGIALDRGEIAPDIDHQSLHCSDVWLTHPVSGEKLHFSVPMPEDMAKVKIE